ncbi:medium-chain acyl-CoA ligase ACSF2, mitochondrial-like, partial [Amphiura filiformis]|uniref:medium-chain acyl-CoA ligase ACSF2, mitochondrial-like n=1 Tax=Amphiura filiformis TaxID=82378 RepID=UPI003B225062
MSQNLTKSYIHVPVKIPFSGKSVGQIFNEVANQNPDKEMYVFYADKERKTFRQMQDESQQFAGGLLKLGLKKGDTLGVWGGNHYEWLLAYLASLQIGVITLGMKVVVLMRSPSDMCDRASQIIPELLTNSADNLNCQITPNLKYVINAGTNPCKGMIALTDFMEMGKGFDKSTVTKAIDQVDVDDPIGVIFTSSCRYALIMSFGGIGAQMGAVMPMIKGGTTIIVGPTYDAQLLANVIQDESEFTVLCPLPGCLLGEIQVSALILIASIALCTILVRRIFADAAAIRLGRSWSLYSWWLDVALDFAPKEEIKRCMSGGSIIPYSLRQRASKITKHILLGYGATEGFAAMQSSTDPIEILHSTGYVPADGSEVKIIGDDGQILPINEIGEICARSRSLFLYYWGEEEKTKAAKKPNGWYHTGDLGTLDENGYLRVVGRKSERIIKEGINIAPGNLEKVFDEHPAVSNVMVSDFLVPKYIIFVEDAFPTTETGK